MSPGQLRHIIKPRFGCSEHSDLCLLQLALVHLSMIHTCLAICKCVQDDSSILAIHMNDRTLQFIGKYVISNGRVAHVSIGRVLPIHRPEVQRGGVFERLLKLADRSSIVLRDEITECVR